jgi:hypothetical protein
VLRLPRSRSQNKQDRRGRWVVHVPMAGGPDAVRRLLKDVQLWLREEQIAETRVRVGGAVHRVRLEDDAAPRGLEAPPAKPAPPGRKTGTPAASPGALRDSTTEGNP